MLKIRFPQFSTYCIILLGIILAVNHKSHSQALSYSSEGNYTFQPGDGIRVKVWQLIPQETGTSPATKLNDDYTIDGDGYALFPIIGRVKVQGMTAERLIEVLNEKYSPYLREPVIYVEPLIRVILQGAFIKPGSYRVKPNSSMWELVELAEGPTADCDLKRMRVERGGAVVIADLLGEFEKGYSITDIGIRSGDQILAPEKSSINFKQIRDYLTFIMTAYLFYLEVQRSH